MKIWNDFVRGISSHFEAAGFIARHQLWIYFIFPAVIMLILFISGFASTFALGDWAAEKVIGLIGMSEDREGFIGILQSALSLFLSLLFKIFLVFVFTSYIKYIVLIFCSPILALLSERVDEIISGKKYPFNLAQFLADIIRGIRVTLRNMLLETLIIIACSFIAFIPVIGWITIPFLWLISWYFMGYSMMDYTFERRKMKISEGTVFIRRNKGLAIGNGLLFSIFMNIPFLGIVAGPVLSVVAATIATTEKLDHTQQAEGINT